MRGSVDILTPRKQIVSTTALLGTSAVYTSDWISVEEFGKVCGTVYAEGSDGNLFIEHSPQTDRADYIETIAVSGGTGQGFNLDTVSSMVRIRYVNGGISAQTTFRLVVFLRGA